MGSSSRSVPSTARSLGASVQTQTLKQKRSASFSTEQSTLSMKDGLLKSCATDTAFRACRGTPSRHTRMHNFSFPTEAPKRLLHGMMFSMQLPFWTAWASSAMFRRAADRNRSRNIAWLSPSTSSSCYGMPSWSGASPENRRAGQQHSSITLNRHQRLELQHPLLCPDRLGARRSREHRPGTQIDVPRRKFHGGQWSSPLLLRVTAQPADSSNATPPLIGHPQRSGSEGSSELCA
jgi:hypothetical protein